MAATNWGANQLSWSAVPSIDPPGHRLDEGNLRRRLV
jgi:hypothetical protein